MENNKILDLSYAADEDFEQIKDVLEKWKADGMIARLYCPSREEIEERMRNVYDMCTAATRQGAKNALLGCIAGAVVATGFILVKDHFVYKRKMEELEKSE